MPKDPVMLLSFLNMKLRDFYPDLHALCEDMDADEEEIIQKLAEIDYQGEKSICLNRNKKEGCAVISVPAVDFAPVWAEMEQTGKSRMCWMRMPFWESGNRCPERKDWQWQILEQRQLPCCFTGRTAVWKSGLPG